MQHRVAAVGTSADVHDCSMHESASGRISARLTVDAATVSTITAANFWPMYILWQESRSGMVFSALVLLWFTVGLRGGSCYIKPWMDRGEFSMLCMQATLCQAMAFQRKQWSTPR